MHRKLNVYLVDDNSSQLQELKRLMKILGHTITGSSSTVQNALKNISTMDPDLIVINSHLAG